MILGLSHIAFSCDDIEAATERLAMFGDARRCEEPRLKNNAATADFMSRFQPEHHIRALAADEAMAIELLDHGGLSGPQSSALIPVFRGVAPFADWQARPLVGLPVFEDGMVMLSDTLGQEPLAFYDPVLSMTLLWIQSKDEAPGLHACTVPTDAPEALKSLLGQLRFRPDTAGMWSLLTPLSALQARLIPVLSKQAKKWAEKPLLDAPGCACMALMARGTVRASLPAALQGKNVLFTMTVNGKNSTITLAQPDTGPIIELVDQPI
jgi:hypothetical protein